MRLVSWGTDGERKRLRAHCSASRDLVYRGLCGGDAVLEVQATDGRTYSMSLSAADLRVLMEAAAAGESA